MRVGLGCGLVVLLLIGAGSPPDADALECADASDLRCHRPGVGPARSIYELRSSFTPSDLRRFPTLPYALYLAPGGTGFTALDTILTRLRVVRIDVSPDDGEPRDDRAWRGPRASGGGGLGTVLVGLRATFGERIETELWCELAGIEVLDHELMVDGAIRPFDLIGLLDLRRP